MKKKCIPIVVCAASLLTAALPASAAFDYGIADDYNVFVFGNYTARNSDTQGRLAVGGDLSLTDYTIINDDSLFYGSLDNVTAATSLVVGGNAKLTSMGVFRGDAIVDGQATVDDSTFSRDLKVNGGLTMTRSEVDGAVSVGGAQSIKTSSYGSLQANAGTAMPFNMGAAQNALTNYSRNTLTSYASTGTASKQWDDYVWGDQLVLTGGSAVDGMQVFNLAASDLTGIKDIMLNGVGDASAVLINIDAQSVNLSSMGSSRLNSLLSGAGNGRDLGYEVLFNFYNAEAITLSSIGMQADILAVDANVTANRGLLIGSMVAGSFDSSENFQFNQRNFTAPVPEPGEYAMMLLGLAMIGFVVRRRLS